jgi:hypothetical protein
MGRPFRAKFAGVCAVTGLQFRAGEMCRYTGDKIASVAAMSDLEVTTKRGELCTPWFHTTVDQDTSWLDDASILEIRTMTKARTIAGYHHVGGRWSRGVQGYSTDQIGAFVRRSFAFRTFGGKVTK